VQSVALISLVVALITSPINLLVDFLFEDVLRAPIKKAPPKKVDPSSGRQSGLVRRVREASQLVKSSSFYNRFAKLKKQAAVAFFSEPTRIIPSQLNQIHSQVSSFAPALCTNLQHAMSHSVKRSQSRLAALLAKQRRSDAHRTPKRIQVSEDYGLENVQVETRFGELSLEIAEQRKLLKKHQQESFDNLWG
jgi:hypothetical protein